MSDVAAKKSTPAWLIGVVAGLFGLFYAYAVWAGVQYLVTTLQELSVQSQLTGVDLALTPLAWVALVMAIAVPVASFAIAMVMGRGKALWKLALLLLVGLAVTSVFWLDVQAFTTTQQVIQQ
ncbi:hypothetical protein GCM10010910_02520 [Microbacterium nanhaiense]|uniref:Bacitracin resistance protein n=1 Tax=Microbacterium nanhaiense TaxID=1301026 RepID=A0ABQ2MXW4_9MICO|nr:hypothetical protein [Microbacterium nanhaiense]GGO59474.1 hypothetical protein GCM10010910_02520 [Microbacterium nanhaiense]